jgi:hypothetical protein
LSILRPSKIDPNWDFWFENKPSGNPGLNAPSKESPFSQCAQIGRNFAVWAICFGVGQKIFRLISAIDLGDKKLA